MTDSEEPVRGGQLPEARLGDALRTARKKRGISLRELARRLYRSHSSLVEYERGHRLAPLDVVQAYETHLSVPRGTLVALHKQAQEELSTESRSPHGSDALKFVTQHGLHQLPADVAAFSGRGHELALLHGVITETLTGPGTTVVISAIAGMAGVGKTALAVHLAHQLAPQFPDAHLYVNLHGYEPKQRVSPAEALDRFLRALGMPTTTPPLGLDEQATRYRALLSGKRALVVLDNASTAEQVRPLLPGSPTCLVLVTSRDRLAGLVATEGAQVISLDVLPSEEATELLARVVGQERVAAEPKAAAEVAQLCGYLPLAVRVAAARMAARPGMRIAELAERLAGKHRLSELKAGDRAVRASFALSYESLDAETACMLRRLGLIAGPDFSAGVAAALMGSTPDAAEELLEALVDAHLLEPAPTSRRYRFHDLLRLYARERLQAQDNDVDQSNAIRRMLYWYLGTVDTATQLLSNRHGLRPEETDDQQKHMFATRTEALSWCEEERVNLVAATRQAADQGFPSLAWRLADTLAAFFYLRYGATYRLEIHEVGLGAARDSNDRQAEAWMLASLGNAYSDSGHLPEAVDYSQEGLRIAREIGFRRGEGRCLNNLGRAYRDLGQVEKAGNCASDALVIFREIGDAYHEGLTLNVLGNVHSDRGQFQQAMSYHEQALGLQQAMGDRWGEGTTLRHLGDVYRRLSRLQEATASLEQARAIYQELGYRHGEARALRSLGLALQHTEGKDAARSCWVQALRLFEEVGAPDKADEIRVYLAQ